MMIRDGTTPFEEETRAGRAAMFSRAIDHHPGFFCTFDSIHSLHFEISVFFPPSLKSKRPLNFQILVIETFGVHVLTYNFVKCVCVFVFIFCALFDNISI